MMLREPQSSHAAHRRRAVHIMTGSGDAAEPNHSGHNFMPLNWNPMNSNLPPDTKWWLQLQPNFDQHKDFTCQQLSGFKDERINKEVDGPTASSELSTSSVPDGNMDCGSEKYDEFSLESSWMMAATYLNSEAKAEDINTTRNNLQDPLKHKMDMGEYLSKDEMMYWKSPKPLVSRKAEKQSLVVESPWARDNKSTPWWRLTDKDELGSLVAQKSSKDNENCDVPRSCQTAHASIESHACVQSLASDGIFSMSSGQKLSGGICNPAELVQHGYSSESFCTKNSLSAEVASPYDTKKRQRKDFSVAKQASESDTSRAQLLEALLHSQTRAREAELAAQKAYNEKEHILTLLFKQASYLFAYKQWVHILQLETLYLQLKIKENQIATLMPVLPWMPLKGNPASKDRRKGKKEKSCKFCKCAVVFAVGLGLVGAGMFLGWTVGWLFPVSRPP